MSFEITEPPFTMEDVGRLEALVLEKIALLSGIVDRGGGISDESVLEGLKKELESWNGLYESLQGYVGSYGGVVSVRVERY